MKLSDRMIKDVNGEITLIPFAVALTAVMLVGFAGGYYMSSGTTQSVDEPFIDEEHVGNLGSEVENLKGQLDLLEGSLSMGRAWNLENIYRLVKFSVVEISAKDVQEDFFDNNQSWAHGSGFVYRDDGLIITNAHVVGGADKVIVTLQNGEKVDAEILAEDVFSDLAVLEIDTSDLETDLKPLELENSQKISPGEQVMAVGSPYRLSGSITTGVVSQVDRTLTPDSIDRRYPIPAVIQIDAAINPGNSGGPLLTFDGKVVGVNTAIQSLSGEFSGIGFSISSNMVERVVTSLIENEEYLHPWIGVSGLDVTPRVLDEMDLDSDWGYLVTEVVENSPASRAGLQEEDLIVEVDGEVVKSIEDILSYIELFKSPGDTLEFEVFRDGEREDVSVTLGTRPRN
ncbi:MAG: S1C family serine protease [Candidatus Hadarchaeota archaeon]